MTDKFFGRGVSAAVESGEKSWFNDAVVPVGSGESGGGRRASERSVG